MGSIKSRLWDLFGANGQPRAIGRAAVLSADDQPTVGLPHPPTGFYNSRRYVGRREWDRRHGAGHMRGGPL